MGGLVMMTITEILDQFEQTVFYPYAFKEELLEREQELLDRIKELENDIIQRDASERN